MDFDRKKYLKISILITVALIFCMVMFAFTPFKEMPFIYQEF